MNDQWKLHPDEPKYCYCNKHSYGEMYSIKLIFLGLNAIIISANKNGFISSVHKLHSFRKVSGTVKIANNIKKVNCLTDINNT